MDDNAIFSADLRALLTNFTGLLSGDAPMPTGIDTLDSAWLASDIWEVEGHFRNERLALFCARLSDRLEADGVHMSAVAIADDSPLHRVFGSAAPLFVVQPRSLDVTEAIKSDRAYIIVVTPDGFRFRGTTKDVTRRER